MKYTKYILILTAIFLFAMDTASAAPFSHSDRTILPETTGRYYLGTSTPLLEWNGIYVKDLIVSGTCTGCGSGITSYDAFTHSSVWGQTTSATSTLLALTGSPISLAASSTAVFSNASTTQFTISGSSWLGTPTQLVGTNISGTAANLTAGTVTTNANLTGVVTSVGNATSYGSQAAGVLGSSITGLTAPLATSTLYGAVQNGRVLAGSGGSLIYLATTTYSGGLLYTAGNVTNTLTAGDGLTRNTDDFDLDIPVLVASGGTGVTSFTANSLLYSNAAGTGIAYAATSSLSIGGNAATVTTNANLTGVVTSVGNTTSYGSQTAGVLGNSITGNTAPMATSTLYGAASTGGFVLQWSNVTNGLVLMATSSSSGGTVTSIVAGDGLLGGTITTSGTLYGQVGTSTVPVLGSLAYWSALGTATAAAKLTSVATSSLAVGAGLVVSSGTLGSQVGGTAATIKQIENRSFTLTGTTTAATGGGFSPITGTSTIAIEIGYGEVWNNMKCFTDVGTLTVQVGYGSASTTMFVASTTIGTVITSSNNTMTAGNKVYLNTGSPASSPTTLTCTVNNTI